LGVLAGQGGLATGPDVLGPGRPGDLGDGHADAVIRRPAPGADGAAGRGPHPEVGVEGEDDQVGQVLGQELEAGLAR